MNQWNEKRVPNLMAGSRAKGLLCLMTFSSLLFGAEAAVSRQQELQVSPMGMSPHVALAKIRAAKAAGDRSAWTVRVAPGFYELTEPLRFRPEDSGTPEAPVRWIAADGEAVFAGGGRIGGWRDDGDGTWSAPLPTDAAGRPIWFQSLYANGRRAVRARHPNTGYFHVDAWHQTAVTNASGVVTYVQHCVVSNEAANALAGLSARERAAVELQSVVKWSYGAFSVAGWDEKTRELTVDSRKERIADWKTWPGKKNLFCLENVRAGFDAPGEWFYDVTAGRVRYRPQPGENLASFEALAPTAGLVSVVRFEGDPAAGREVTDISFEGVTFALSRTDGDRLESGFVQQYQLQAARNSGGCVYAKGTRRISLVRCRVTKTENYAVRFDVGCVSNRVVGCELTDLGAGGVMVGDTRQNYFAVPGENDRVPHPGRVIPYGSPIAAPFHPCAFVTVDDCEIAYTGRVNPEGCGVLILQASDCAVTHCDIHDLTYTGVSVGWTWGYSGSLAQRNTVAFNRIRDVGQGVMSDMGGIYTLGTSFGTCISNNVVHAVRAYSYGGWGLYNDEGSEGIVWENNLVYDTASDAYHQHYGRNNVLRNNILACARECQLRVSLAEAHRSLTVERNIICWEDGGRAFRDAASRYAFANGKETWEEVKPTGRPIADVAWSSNLFWCVTGMTAIESPLTGLVADPLFADVKARDFRLLPNSPAMRLGFRPWDIKAAGRR